MGKNNINKFSLSGTEPLVVPGPRGNGGAPSEYTVVCPITGEVLLEVKFQQGSGVEGWTGVIDLSLLEIVNHRLTAFQEGKFASRETALARTNVEQAALWQCRRTMDRMARNVHDKQEK